MATNLSIIPAGYVRIERVTYRYARSRNGAWYGTRGADRSEHVVPEDKAIDYVNGSAEFVTAVWPDGHTESFDRAVTPIRFSAWGPGVETEKYSHTFSDGTVYHGERMKSRLGRVGYYAIERAAS